jgi:hypothetical protein
LQLIDAWEIESSKFMTEIETYLRYQDVFGTPSTLEQFETLMRVLDLGLMLRLFSPVNTICARRGLPNRDQAQLALIRELFDEGVARKTLACGTKSGRGVTVFHRKQCLFILREAMRLCPDLPGMQPADIRESLALVSLMANDHVSATAPQGTSPLDQIAALMCDFIPVTEANELRFDMASVSRMHKIVHDIAPARAQGPAYFDIRQLFEQASGLPLTTYEALSLAIMPRVLKSAVEVLTHSPDYGVHINYFDQTQLSESQRDAFFRLLARTPDEFRARVKGRVPSLSDFTIFKETPFLRNPDRLVPMDMTACMEKFEASVFWTIFRSLPEEQKEPFTSFWATVFEDYIDWLLTNSVDQSQNRFYPSPRYADGRREEVCDGIVVSGTTAIFIECKGGFIRGDAKYGGDPAKLRAEIEKKYVTPKGVFQIAKSIVTATNRANPRPIEGVDLSRVTTIMPVLIIRDDIGDGFFVNTYLNARFQDAKGGLNISKAIAPVYCAQLICMSVDVIEKLTPYLIDTRFSGILADRIMSDRDLRGPFFMKPLSSLSAKGTRPPHLLRELNAELSKVAAAFLKVESNSERDAA